MNTNEKSIANLKKSNPSVFGNNNYQAAFFYECNAYHIKPKESI
jgi:hypothetical protein